MAEHTCKVIFDDSVAARKWGVWCDSCRKIIAACQSQADAEDCLANHVRWQTLKESFSR